MSNIAIVITTINPCNECSVPCYINSNTSVIVVGDRKTPHDTYKNNDNITYISDDIRSDFSQLDQLLPFNHYCRKNLGYIKATQKGCNVIFDTDDDNYPLTEGLSLYDVVSNIMDTSQHCFVTSPKFPNVANMFSDRFIWSRGYPLEYVANKSEIEVGNNSFNPNNIGIIQYLVNGEPDVDAIFRLTSTEYIQEPNFQFKMDKTVVLDKHVYTQGNTQSTLWLQPELFFLLYIPCTVSFRFCDILKMYIAQRVMWKYDKLFCVASPILFQARNEHDFFKDFLSELPMYSSLVHIVTNVLDRVELNGDKYDLKLIYTLLHIEGIVQSSELTIIDKWLTFF